MADWLDIFLRLWENFGMWGVIILLVFLVLYFTVRALYRSGAKRMYSIERLIAEQLAVLGSRDISMLIQQVAQNDHNPRFTHFVDGLLRVGELYRQACSVHVPWVYRPFRKYHLEHMSIRFHGIESLLDDELLALIRSFRARY